jgi:Flp pilus assembly protein TadB
MNRPGALRYVAYSFGRKLPDGMRDWVRNDLTGEHALARHLFRSMVPFLPVFVAGLLVPGPLVLRVACVLLALILALIYSFAFMDMNRRRRLSQHGFPEDLENARKARRRNDSRQQYEQHYRHAG